MNQQLQLLVEWQLNNEILKLTPSLWTKCGLFYASFSREERNSIIRNEVYEKYKTISFPGPCFGEHCYCWSLQHLCTEWYHWCPTTNSMPTCTWLELFTVWRSPKGPVEHCRVLVERGPYAIEGIRRPVIHIQTIRRRLLRLGKHTNFALFRKIKRELAVWICLTTLRFS